VARGSANSAAAKWVEQFAGVHHAPAVTPRGRLFREIGPKRPISQASKARHTFSKLFLQRPVSRYTFHIRYIVPYKEQSKRR
jgi:hypothetical protein